MTIRIEKRKWPNRLVTSWDAHPLGEDEFGRWFLSREGEIHMTPAKTDGWVVPGDAVQLIPRDAWWVAGWWSEDRWISVDIAMPAEDEDGTVHYVDLEIDVVRNQDGEVKVYDLDEFEELRGAGLPEDVASQALQTTDIIQRNLLESVEPFKSRGWQRLEDR